MAAIPTPITTVRVTAPIRTVPITATVTTRQFTASATAMPRARIMAATTDTGTAIGIVTVIAIGIAIGAADSGLHQRRGSHLPRRFFLTFSRS